MINNMYSKEFQLSKFVKGYIPWNKGMAKTFENTGIIFEFKRNCPSCGREIVHRNKRECIAKYICKRGMKLNSKCKSCATTGQIHLDETRYKMRLSAINRINKQGISRSYNPIACQFIDNLNKKQGWNLQHALNGGEVELYGYFVDGYDKEKNIIFEYDEKYHNSPSKKNRDLIRQKDLVNKINPTIFVRYNEKDKIIHNILGNKNLLCI